jgi:phosphotransferase system HPr (HPr) family protein
VPEIALAIRNKNGLHARPAALFVQEAVKYKAQIGVRNGNLAADAKSILGVLTLGVHRGCTIVVSAEGEDAEQALEAIRALVESGLGDEV